MNRYALIKDSINDNIFGVVVDSNGLSKFYGVSAKGIEWSKWANGISVKSEDNGLPVGVVVGEYSLLRNQNPSYIQALIDTVSLRNPSVNRKQGLNDSYIMSSKSVVPAVRDAEIRAFDVDKRADAINFKARAFRTDSKVSSLLTQVRTEQLGFVSSEGAFSSRNPVFTPEVKQAEIIDTYGRSIQRSIGKNIIRKKSQSMVAVVPMVKVTSSGIQFKAAGLGPKIGSRLSGGLRAAPAGMSFVDVTGVTDADTDGIVFEGKPGLERPIIPRFIVPKELARKLSGIVEGDAEAIEKQRRAGNTSVQFDEGKLRKIIESVGGDADLLKAVTGEDGIPATSPSGRERLSVNAPKPTNVARDIARDAIIGNRVRSNQRPDLGDPTPLSPKQIAELSEQELVDRLIEDRFAGLNLEEAAKKYDLKGGRAEARRLEAREIQRRRSEGMRSRIRSAIWWPQFTVSEEDRMDAEDRIRGGVNELIESTGSLFPKTNSDGTHTIGTKFGNSDESRIIEELFDKYEDAFGEFILDGGGEIIFQPASLDNDQLRDIARIIGWDEGMIDMIPAGKTEGMRSRAASEADKKAVREFVENLSREGGNNSVSRAIAQIREIAGNIDDGSKPWEFELDYVSEALGITGRRSSVSDVEDSVQRGIGEMLNNVINGIEEYMDDNPDDNRYDNVYDFVRATRALLMGGTKAQWSRPDEDSDTVLEHNDIPYLSIDKTDNGKFILQEGITTPSSNYYEQDDFDINEIAGPFDTIEEAQEAGNKAYQERRFNEELLEASLDRIDRGEMRDGGMRSSTMELGRNFDQLPKDEQSRRIRNAFESLERNGSVPYGVSTGDTGVWHEWEPAIVLAEETWDDERMEALADLPTNRQNLIEALYRESDEFDDGFDDYLNSPEGSNDAEDAGGEPELRDYLNSQSYREHLSDFEDNNESEIDNIHSLLNGVPQRGGMRSRLRSEEVGLLDNQVAGDMTLDEVSSLSDSLDGFIERAQKGKASARDIDALNELRDAFDTAVAANDMVVMDRDQMLRAADFIEQEIIRSGMTDSPIIDDGNLIDVLGEMLIADREGDIWESLPIQMGETRLSMPYSDVTPDRKIGPLRRAARKAFVARRRAQANRGGMRSRLRSDEPGLLDNQVAGDMTLDEVSSLSDSLDMFIERAKWTNSYARDREALNELRDAFDSAVAANDMVVMDRDNMRRALDFIESEYIRSDNTDSPIIDDGGLTDVLGEILQADSEGKIWESLPIQMGETRLSMPSPDSEPRKIGPLRRAARNAFVARRRAQANRGGMRSQSGIVSGDRYLYQDDVTRIGRGGKTRINIGDSRAVRALTWDDDNSNLIVTYGSGKTYTYLGVNDEFVRDLEEHPDSIGKIVNRIKNSGTPFEVGGEHADFSTLSSDIQRQREKLGMRSQVSMESVMRDRNIARYHIPEGTETWSSDTAEINDVFFPRRNFSGAEDIGYSDRIVLSALSDGSDTEGKVYIAEFDEKAGTITVKWGKANQRERNLRETTYVGKDEADFRKLLEGKERRGYRLEGGRIPPMFGQPERNWKADHEKQRQQGLRSRSGSIKLRPDFEGAMEDIGERQGMSSRMAPSASRIRAAEMEVSSRPRGMASRRSEGLRDPRYAVPGANRVDPSDGQLWARLSDEDKKTVAERAAQREKYLLGKFKERFPSWWRRANSEADKKGWDKDFMRGGNEGWLDELHRFVTKLGDDPNYPEKSRLEAEKEFNDLQALFNMRRNRGEYDLLEHLHPTSRRFLFDDARRADGKTTKISASGKEMKTPSTAPRPFGEPIDVGTPIREQVGEKQKKPLKERLDAFYKRMSDKILYEDPARKARREMRKARRQGINAGGYSQEEASPVDDAKRKIRKRKRLKEMRKYRTRDAGTITESSKKNRVDGRLAHVGDAGEIVFGDKLVPTLSTMMENLRTSKKMKKTTGSTNKNRPLAVLWDGAGYNGTPSIITSDEFKALHAAGWLPIVRGHGGGSNGVRYADDYIDSPIRFIPGQGGEAQGEGEYWARATQGGGGWFSWMDNSQPAGTVALLPPSTRRVGIKELRAIQQEHAPLAKAIKQFDAGLPEGEREKMSAEEYVMQLRDHLRTALGPTFETTMGTRMGKMTSKILDSLSGSSATDKKQLLDSLEFLEVMSKQRTVNGYAPLLGYDSIIAESGVELIHNRTAVVVVGDTFTRDDAVNLAKSKA